MASTYYILKAGVAPLDLAARPPHVRIAFWSWVVELGLRRKDWELARGLNARGEPLPGVSAETRKHRKSAMTPSGKGDPSAPYLMPARGLSRTRSLLTGKPHADYAEFFWRYDAHTGDQWGRVLAWHAARGKAYDVIGLSPAGIAWVAAQARARWRAWLRTAATPIEPIIPAQAAFAPAPAESGGRTNLTHAVFGIGGSRAQYEQAAAEGRTGGGFRTQAEWQAHFRAKRVVSPIARPETTASSVRKGAGNVLLQHVWGGTPRPPQTAVMTRVALPPKPKPTVTPKPEPVPTPKPVARPKPKRLTKAQNDEWRRKFAEDQAKAREEAARKEQAAAEAEYDRLVAAARFKVENGGLAKDRAVHLLRWVEKLPTHVRDALREFGVTLGLGETVTEAHPGVVLEGSRIRGWPADATLANATGYYRDGERRAVVPNTFTSLSSGEQTRNHTASGTVLHELGHAYDQAMKYISQSNEFVAAWDRDLAEMSQAKKDELSYFTSASVQGPSEVFAEMMPKILLGGGEEFLKAFPECLKLMRLYLKGRES